MRSRDPMGTGPLTDGAWGENPSLMTTSKFFLSEEPCQDTMKLIVSGYLYENFKLQEVETKLTTS
jgi:hypothetical protein